MEYKEGDRVLVLGAKRVRKSDSGSIEKSWQKGVVSLVNKDSGMIEVYFKQLKAAHWLLPECSEIKLALEENDDDS